MNISIHVSRPECYGAPYPAFNRKRINESQFDEELRSKYCEADIEDGSATIKWLSQEAPHPSEEWEEEVKRAFKANGYRGPIEVKFGSRDTGYIHEYTIQVA